MISGFLFRTNFRRPCSAYFSPSAWLSSTPAALPSLLTLEITRNTLPSEVDAMTSANRMHHKHKKQARELDEVAYGNPPHFRVDADVADKLEAADPHRHPDRRKQRMIEKSTRDRTHTSGLNQRLRVEDAMEAGDGAGRRCEERTAWSFISHGSCHLLLGSLDEISTAQKGTVDTSSSKPSSASQTPPIKTVDEGGEDQLHASNSAFYCHRLSAFSDSLPVLLLLFLQRWVLGVATRSRWGTGRSSGPSRI
ncbi:hypothetical protein MUK42_24881 [Musa troglodytarum]|uniref:Uncharacterized protein n=1 Tax=Musa troglodytarum TaxID=320322 RepID=A0A9E7EC75_9LILI|nr:hypothetical protein MUK42_24881 [Musa troglodytarum]URD74427.1 hypothetical protein MUK42_24881 [Musa troglodytarum]